MQNGNLPPWLAAASDNSAAKDREPAKQATLLRVRVLEGGRPTVNIRVLTGVAKWGMKMAQAFSPQMKDADLDWEAITAIIQEGEQGQIVEVEDEVNHKTVRGLGGMTVTANDHSRVRNLAIARPGCGQGDPGPGR